MIFQKVLKGIAGISHSDASSMFAGAGIVCNWWRNNGGHLPAGEIPDRLTEDEIFHHLHDYDILNPTTGQTYGHWTPFISTTAGGIERDRSACLNITHSAFITALEFATDFYKTSGAIFYGYVNVLGRKSISLQEFAEETRELNIWTDFQPYHREGEIVAKISIPATHLERAVGYDGPAARVEIAAGRLPVPSWVLSNHRCYIPPEDICNVRDPIL